MSANSHTQQSSATVHLPASPNNSNMQTQQHQQHSTSGILTGLWKPLSISHASLSAACSKSDVKEWPSLVFGILKLELFTLQPREDLTLLKIQHSPHQIEVMQQSTEHTHSPASHPLTLHLDEVAHTFHTGPNSSAPLTITAKHLSEDEHRDVSIRIQFPTVDKKGNLVTKFSSFSDEQVARNRSGFINERSHRSDPHTMTQLVEYRRAPQTLKNEVVALMEQDDLPVLYSVKRTFKLVEPKSDASHSRSHSQHHAEATVPHSPTPVSTPAKRHQHQSSSSSLSSPNGSAPSLPYCSLSGVWKVDSSRSDSLDGMMKELNVAWLARKVILSLDVTTHIQHDPSIHQCVVTDTSSAGEQATVHATTGDWNTVKTKEGKLIKMCAKEGEEMRHIWTDLPEAMANAPLSFPASTIPFEFPSYLPVPYSPALKLHPLPYGYLWIHSHLPDIAGGEMQDIRILLDRDVMLQQSMIIKNQKLVHTTTRYFNKIESESEKRKNEEEWEKKIDMWKKHRQSLHSASEDNSDIDSESSSRRSDSRASSISLPSSPAPTQLLVGAGPHPNLTGTWSVIKDRSNDLSILLKRMGVPWIYRAFANSVDIRTSITHTMQELTLKDTSKFGSHSQTYKLDGVWAPVVQYGKQRQGLCFVHSDSSKQSVTVETVYFEPRKRKGETESTSTRDLVRVPRNNSVSESKEESQEELENSSRLLTVESVDSPAHRSAISTDENILAGQDSSSHVESVSQKLERVDLDAPRSQSAEHSPHHSHRRHLAVEEADTKLRERSNSDPTARQMIIQDLMAVDGTVGEVNDATTVASTDPSVSASPHADADNRSSNGIVHTPHSAASSTPASPTPIGNAVASFSSSASSVVPPLSNSSSFSSSSSALSHPGYLPAPSLPGQVATSRLLDIRVLLAPDLMRQVITYLEFGVVVCVCSRYYKRELTKQEMRDRADAKKAEDRKRDEDAKKRRDEQKQQEDERKRKREQAEARRSSRFGGSPLGQQRSNSSPQTSDTAQHTNSNRVHGSPNSPVSVVLPSAVAAASTSKSFSESLSFPFPALNATHVLLFFLLLVALASGNTIFTIVVAAGIASYFFKRSSFATHSGSTTTNGISATSASTLTLNADRSDSHAASTFAPKLAIAPNVEVEIVPLRRNNN